MTRVSVGDGGDATGVVDGPTDDEDAVEEELCTGSRSDEEAGGSGGGRAGVACSDGGGRTVVARRPTHCLVQRGGRSRTYWTSGGGSDGDGRGEEVDSLLGAMGGRSQMHWTSGGGSDGNGRGEEVASRGGRSRRWRGRRLGEGDGGTTSLGVHVLGLLAEVVVQSLRISAEDSCGRVRRRRGAGERGERAGRDAGGRGSRTRERSSWRWSSWHGAGETTVDVDVYARMTGARWEAGGGLARRCADGQWRSLPSWRVSQGWRGYEGQGGVAACGQLRCSRAVRRRLVIGARLACALKEMLRMADRVARDRTMEGGGVLAARLPRRMADADEKTRTRKCLRREASWVLQASVLP